MVKCSNCGTHYNKDGSWFQKHIRNCKAVNKETRSINSNYINNQSLLINFNLTMCDKEKDISSDDDVDHDTAFLSDNRNKNQLVEKVGIRSFKIQKNFLTKNRSKFSVGLLNINSLFTKIDEISFILENQLIDILIFNVTKLNESNDELLITFQNYTLLRRDRIDSNGGGVVIYVKKSISISNIINDPVNEIICFKISHSNNVYGMIGCYRPPHFQNENSLFASLNKHVKTLEQSCIDIFIVGDMNYNLLNDKQDCKLNDFMSTAGFSNTICSGTRLNPINGILTLLDVILCMKIYLLFISKSFYFPSSVHLMLISLFNISSSPRFSRSFTSRCLNKNTVNKIKLKIDDHFS